MKSAEVRSIIKVYFFSKGLRVKNTPIPVAPFTGCGKVGPTMFTTVTPNGFPYGAQSNYRCESVQPRLLLPAFWP